MVSDKLRLGYQDIIIDKNAYLPSGQFHASAIGRHKASGRTSNMGDPVTMFVEKPVDLLGVPVGLVIHDNLKRFVILVQQAAYRGDQQIVPFITGNKDGYEWQVGAHVQVVFASIPNLWECGFAIQ